MIEPQVEARRIAVNVAKLPELLGARKDQLGSAMGVGLALWLSLAIGMVVFFGLHLVADIKIYWRR